MLDVHVEIKDAGVCLPVCSDSATAHDALDEALELSVHMGGGPDHEIVDVDSHQQRSATFDVMETWRKKKL